MNQLNLLYTHGTYIGYGRLGTLLAAELEKKGVEIFDHLPDPDPEQERNMAYLNGGRNSGISKSISWISTPSHARGWYEGQRASILTMWEATRLPEQFRENLHNFETVIVPSQQNLELFSDYHKDVRLVPLGVDPARWRFVPRHMPLTEFRFMIGGSGARKGPDLARTAFRRAFPHAAEMFPRPRLVMKSPKGEDMYGNPDVEIVAGRLTDEDEVALYESIHCYLQPSRGEGFGLQPLQAMAQGIPTILTNAHGHAGFAHLGMGIGWKYTKAADFIQGDAGDWWEPDIDELIDQMLWVYDNYRNACANAAISAEVIAEDWTWERTAEKYLDAIGGWDELGLLEDTSKWFVPTLKVFPVVTSRDYTCDIGGTMRFFKQGEKYWEPADVKRIMFDLGVLDPSCLVGDEEIGLTELQLQQVEDYTAARSHCPTCGQRLNSSPTKADDIFEQLQAEAMAEGRP